MVLSAGRDVEALSFDVNDHRSMLNKDNAIHLPGGPLPNRYESSSSFVVELASSSRIAQANSSAKASSLIFTTALSGAGSN